MKTPHFKPGFNMARIVGDYVPDQSLTFLRTVSEHMETLYRVVMQTSHISQTGTLEKIEKLHYI